MTETRILISSLNQVDGISIRFINVQHDIETTHDDIITTFHITYDQFKQMIHGFESEIERMQKILRAIKEATK